MTAPGPPVWRQLYDRVDSVITPAAESLVRTTGFSRTVALLSRANAMSRSAARALSARWWHQLNLPAATDVTRLRRELGSLDREVRRLSLELDRRREQPAGGSGADIARGVATNRKEVSDAEHTSTGPGSRPGTTRRRAQRPANP